MLEGDPLRDGEAETGTALFRRRVGLEEPCCDVGCDSRAVVADFEAHVLAVLVGGERHPAARGSRRRVERVLHEIGEDLDHLVPVGTQDLRPAPPHVRQLGFAGGGLVHLHDVLRELLRIERLGPRRGEARESRELGHDVGDAMHLVEHGSRRFVEVLVERRIVARSKSAQRLDGSSDGRQRIFHLVGDATGDLAPRRDAARRGEPPPRHREILEHSIEGENERLDLGRAFDRERSSLSLCYLAGLGCEHAQRTTQAPREHVGCEERGEDGDRRREGHRPIDVAQILFELPGRAEDLEGDRTRCSVETACRSRAALDRGGERRHRHHRHAEGRAELAEQGIEVTSTDHPHEAPAIRTPRATSDEGRDGGHPQRKARAARVKEAVDLGPGRREERLRGGSDELATLRGEHQLVEIEGLPMAWHELGQAGGALIELAGVEGNPQPFGQLPFLASTADDPIVALRLPRHFSDDALADVVELGLEPECFFFRKAMAHGDADADRGHGREQAEGDGESGGEAQDEARLRLQGFAEKTRRAPHFVRRPVRGVHAIHQSRVHARPSTRIRRVESLQVFRRYRPGATLAHTGAMGRFSMGFGVRAALAAMVFTLGCSVAADEEEVEGSDSAVTSNAAQRMEAIRKASIQNDDDFKNLSQKDFKRGQPYKGAPTADTLVCRFYQPDEDWDKQKKEIVKVSAEKMNGNTPKFRCGPCNLTPEEEAAGKKACNVDKVLKVKYSGIGRDVTEYFDPAQRARMSLWNAEDGYGDGPLDPNDPNHQSRIEPNGEVWGEVMSTRILWGLGFYADAVYPTKVVCHGCPAVPFRATKRDTKVASRHFFWSAVEAKFPGETVEMSEDQGFDLGADKEDMRNLGKENGAKAVEIEAWKLLAAFVVHADNKPENNRVMCEKNMLQDDGTCAGKSYVLYQDVGNTFGSSGTVLGLGTTYKKAEYAAWKKKPVWANAGSLEAKLESTWSLSNPQVTRDGCQFLATRLKALAPESCHANLASCPVNDIFTASRVGYRGEQGEFVNPTTGSKEKRQVSAEDWTQLYIEKVKELASACGG